MLSTRHSVSTITRLNGASFAWHAQVSHFASSLEYSVLVFDNRGVGHSSVPMGPYTTSAMAGDCIALLDFVGWSEKRGVHVVGLSLGGMIAQGELWARRRRLIISLTSCRLTELAASIPERIASLSLVVTTPGGSPWNNAPPVGIPIVG